MEDNNSNDLLQEQIQDESTELAVPETKRSVYTDQGDPEIDSLYRKWKKGILIIQRVGRVERSETRLIR